jgi:hypothetical protein
VQPENYVANKSQNKKAGVSRLFCCAERILITSSLQEQLAQQLVQLQQVSQQHQQLVQQLVRKQRQQLVLVPVQQQEPVPVQQEQQVFDRKQPKQ